MSVATPDELDRLLDFVSSGRATTTTLHEGEHLFATERLVVSPAAGVFTPLVGIEPGTVLEVGTVVGHVAGTEVRSPFAGVVQGYIALEGERVTSSQPIVWLRTL
jgi:[acyl-carrier-protein] S-malonyltransferase